MARSDKVNPRADSTNRSVFFQARMAREVLSPLRGGDVRSSTVASSFGGASAASMAGSVSAIIGAAGRSAASGGSAASLGSAGAIVAASGVFAAVFLGRCVRRRFAGDLLAGVSSAAAALVRGDRRRRGFFSGCGSIDSPSVPDCSTASESPTLAGTGFSSTLSDSSGSSEAI